MTVTAAGGTAVDADSKAHAMELSYEQHVK